MKFAHLGIGVRDLKRSAAFYNKVFAAIGLPLVDESETAVRFGQNKTALFYIHTREPAPGPIHVAFEAKTREAVDAFHRAALAAGGKDHGPPWRAGALQSDLLRGLHHRSGWPQSGNRLPLTMPLHA